MPSGEHQSTSETRHTRVSRNLSVFINCPYDEKYAPIFDGIVFATVCCGYAPRCAMETSSVAEPRIRRIVRALKDSKYSIHDLCRCQGQDDQNLARFNMPLELGIAMAERFDEEKPNNWHDWLVLVPNGNVYARFVSDLAGYDPKQIDEKIDAVIPAVMSWLMTREDAVPSPYPQKVLSSLPDFVAARETLRKKWLGQEPWSRVVTEAISVGQKNGLIPSK